MITLTIMNYVGDNYSFSFNDTSGGVMAAFPGTIARTTLKTITSPYHKAASTSGISISDFRTAGVMIYSQLPEEVQEYLQSDPQAPLLIQTNDISVPWELYHDENDYQVLSRPIGRMLILPVRIRQKGRTIDSLAKPSVLVIANPGRDNPELDLSEADKEGDSLREFFQSKGCNVNMLAGNMVTRFNVMAHLQGTFGTYDIIHYAGHAALEKAEGKTFASLILADGSLSSEEIRRSLRGSPLVFLNACHTISSGKIRNATDFSTYSMGSQNSLDLAQAFSLGNQFGSARALIGTLFRNNDTRSREMALSYYESLMAGAPIGESLRTSRKQIFSPTDVTWASYVLYGDPRISLLSQKTKAPQEPVLVGTEATSELQNERPPRKTETTSVNDTTEKPSTTGGEDVKRNEEQLSENKTEERKLEDPPEESDTGLTIEMLGDTAIKAIFNSLQETGNSACKMLTTPHLFLGMATVEESYTHTFLRTRVKDPEPIIKVFRGLTAMLSEGLDTKGLSVRIKNILQLAEEYSHLDPDLPGVIEEKHLLQGFFEDGGGFTASTLTELGVKMPSSDRKAILVMPLFTKERNKPMAPSGRKAIDNAFQEARSMGHPVLTTPHLFIGVLQVDQEGVRKVIRDAGVEPKQLEHMLRSVLTPGQQNAVTKIVVSQRFYRILELSRSLASAIEAKHIGIAILREGLEDPNSITIKVLQHCGLDPVRLLRSLQEGSSDQPDAGSTGVDDRTATPILDKIGKDLTRLARDGKLGVVVGRDKDIDTISEILLRKSKACPVLIGEAGVGKTSIVEGFAGRLVNGNAPSTLQGIRVIEIATNDLLAGTKYRGDFEERMRGIVNEVTKAGNIILFLDEIHTLIGAGGSRDGAMDAGDILKPALARGEIKCIGATTIDEYRRHIESDAALERRFSPIMVGEPSEEEAVQILEGIRVSYEDHHGVIILPGTIQAAVRLSSAGFPHRRLPDKAIDLLDQACARVQRLQENESGVTREARPEVTENHLREVLSVLTGVPTPGAIGATGDSSSDRLLALETALNSRVIGQREAVTALVRTISLSDSGMRELGRPLSVMMFMGPVGVGKSSLAKAFADESGRELIQLDMSEYSERHQVAKLIGSPAGYIGHGREGFLTGKLRNHPHSVVLLDEMEKAHPEVSRLFLHLFEEGRITDAKGKTIEARHSIFIMTSNLGGDSKKGGGGKIGFLACSGGTDGADLRETLKTSFSREFIDRIDRIVQFGHLERPDLEAIVRRLLDDTWARLAEQHGMTVEEDQAVVGLLCDQGYDPDSGVRPLKRALNKHVVEPVSKLILDGRIAGKAKFKVSVAAGKMFFAVE